MRYLVPLLFLLNIQAFSQRLSPAAEISLLTISPGEELYSTFGHSAIRVSDPLQGIDVNYNYGTFNFDPPGFYIKFLRGYLNYIISSYNSNVEIDYYARSNRLITEQVLNLTQAQKQKVFDFLENNLKPENREYRYLFFTDNCSSRLRDVLLTACEDSLKFDTGYNGTTTFREWIGIYSEKNNLKWAKFGMNLAVGMGSDQETGWSDAMFLPDNLMKALDRAQVVTDSGLQPVVISKRDLNQVVNTSKTGFFTPLTVFITFMLLVLVYTIYQIRFNNNSIAFDKIFFTILGIGGWILIFLWFGTDHGVTRNNQNLIWLSPLLFPAIFKLKSWGRISFMIYAVVFILGIFYFTVVSSFKFSAEVIFISIAILFRLYFLFNQKKIGFTKN